jgi:Ca2+/H+ antiporter, TMEM165/GDT1 family
VDSLFPALIAAFLAEWGDKTQLLVGLLALRFTRPASVIIGVSLAAIANASIAAIAGRAMAGQLAHDAATLLTGLALLFAAAGALWPQKLPELSSYGLNSALPISNSAIKPNF